MRVLLVALGILLVADEVICGFGRTRNWFGSQTLNIRPDIMTIAKGVTSGYLRENYHFHMTIYEAANAPLLVDLAQGLWLRFGPSLRVVCGRFGTQNLPDRHQQALKAMRARDGEAAAQAILEDLEQGFEQVRLSLAD